MEYLYQYASEFTQRNNRLSFKLKCFRGQNTFMLLENYFSAGEKQLIKEYEEKLPNIGLHTIHGGIDTKSKPYHYIKILGIFKKQIVFPESPYFMDIKLIRAVCPQYHKGLLLFDSRYHGYDTTMSDNKEANYYISHFKKEAKLYEIRIYVENEPSFEAFLESSNENISFELYSKAFTWMRIDGMNEKGKKKVFLDIKTA